MAPLSDYSGPRSLPPGQRQFEELKPVQYGRVPRIKLEQWKLTISGATADGGSTTLTWADVEGMEQTEVVADHHCVAHASTLDLRWGGVAARSVLDLAPPAPDAEFALVYAMYGYSASIRVCDLSSPRAILATSLNGEPLAPEHGWPMRLVLPHLYGWKGPKWLVAIEYHRTRERGFWEQRGYHVTGDVWREERYAHQE